MAKIAEDDVYELPGSAGKTVEETEDMIAVETELVFKGVHWAHPVEQIMKHDA